MAGEFGESAPGWGDAPEGDDLEPEGSELLPDEIDIGGGLKFKINHRAVRAMLNSPATRRQVDARGEAIAKTANDMSITPHAKYTYVPSTHPDATRARGRVETSNYQAQIDDSRHSTLLKALAAHPSDPKPDEHEGEGGEA